MSTNLAYARYKALLILVLFVATVLFGLAQWFKSPGDWNTPVPDQADRVVWVEAQNTGFIDQHLFVDVYLRDDPWLRPASDRHIGAYTSPLEDGPYYSVSFDFEWVGADTLHIYAQNHDLNQLANTGKWLVAVVIPSQNRAFSPMRPE